MRPPVKRLPLLGLLAFIFYGLHGGRYVLGRDYEQLLWGCDVAAALVAIALSLGLPTLNGIAVMWLSFGFPAWAIDCATGGGMVLTSPLIHVGSLILGLIGVRRLGLPAGTWWKALIGTIALHLLSRWLTSPAANINVAHSIWRGWDRIFLSHTRYVIAVHAMCGLSFFLTEKVLRRFLSRAD